MDVAELLRDDWAEVMAFASGVNGPYGNYHGTPGAVGEDPPEPTPFNVTHVAEVLHASEGARDERDWILVLRLKDGRFACVTAGCDYTGWDCRAGGVSSVASSYEDLVRFGLGTAERERLGLEVRL